MLIFRLKKQLHLLPIVLFSFLGIFLITNNPVMAMEKNKPLQTFYNIETNNVRINQNKPIKISYYVKDKNLSLEDMAKNINIINKIK
ncbi:SVM family protein [Candidatus Phytoplasma solani]|uniref:SVM family protein n=1 Tax=Candidatus Phytoplasma solani TaxID=69896 RepID=UPI00359016E9